MLLLKQIERDKMKTSTKLMTTVGALLMSLAFSANATLPGDDSSRGQYDNSNHGVIFNTISSPYQMKDNTTHDLGYSDVRG